MAAVFIWRELFDRIRDIRSSEKVMYQHICFNNKKSILTVRILAYFTAYYVLYL